MARSSNETKQKATVSNSLSDKLMHSGKAIKTAAKDDVTVEEGKHEEDTAGAHSEDSDSDQSKSDIFEDEGEEVMPHRLANKPRPNKEPPKLAVRAPVQFYRTADNKLRRVYRNRCERYCIGPLGIFVDAIGFFVIPIVNLLLLIFAVVCLGIGSTIMRKSDPYDSVVDAVGSKYDAAIDELGVPEDERGTKFNIEDYLQVSAVPFLTLGVTIATVSFMGLISTLLFYQSLLQMYTRVSIILLLIEFCVFLFIYDGEPTVFKREMFETLKNYNGYKGTDTITGAWNLLMQYLECCGVDSYLDFHSSDKWVSSAVSTRGKEYVTPIFCCKVKSTDFACAEKGKATPENNNMEKGCYNTLYDSVFRYPFVQPVFYIVMVLQVVVIFFSSWMYMSRGLQEVKPLPIPIQEKEEEI